MDEHWQAARADVVLIAFVIVLEDRDFLLAPLAVSTLLHGDK
jgi:hypothetical protein